MALINLDDVIYRLRRDRRRCFVVTGRPREGKTRLAKQMATRYGGHRLDLLATFAEDSDLTTRVESFSPKDCQTLLQASLDGELLLADEMEFLWHRWDDREKREFLTLLKLWSHALVGVFLPADPIVQGFDMPDQDGQTRIFGLHELQNLG